MKDLYMYLCPKTYNNSFYSLQCKQYVSQYGPVVVQQLMSMVSLPSSLFRFIGKGVVNYMNMKSYHQKMNWSPKLIILVAHYLPC